jgi:hypothetical protein
MYIESNTRTLHLGKSLIPLSLDELAAYHKQRNSKIVGDQTWSDEKVLAFVLWKSGNPSLSTLIEYYDNLQLRLEF